MANIVVGNEGSDMVYFGGNIVYEESRKRRLGYFLPLLRPIYTTASLKAIRLGLPNLF